MYEGHSKANLELDLALELHLELDLDLGLDLELHLDLDSKALIVVEGRLEFNAGTYDCSREGSNIVDNAYDYG